LVFFLSLLNIVTVTSALPENQGGLIETVPEFILSTPKGHFAGVSGPCVSIQDARRAAILDVTRQILSAIGTSFDHKYSDRITGNPHGNELKRFIEDHLFGSSKGIVFGVEQRVVQSQWIQDKAGRFIFYVLVLP
jgi:hypothetical protein